MWKEQEIEKIDQKYWSEVHAATEQYRAQKDLGEDQEKNAAVELQRKIGNARTERDSAKQMVEAKYYGAGRLEAADKRAAQQADQVPERDEPKRR